MMSGMTYAGSGVDYGGVDPFKIYAQQTGERTAQAIERLGFREVPGIRGESAYVVECLWGDFCLAHVQEGLGTKNLVADAAAQMEIADAVGQVTGRSYYDTVGVDTVAMIINDIVTVGAAPLTVAMHLAVADAAWFDDEQRMYELIEGWERACSVAGASWGGGETPVLKDIFIPGTVELSGSATGLIRPKSELIRGSIGHGDAIILLESSGIHANGLTLARTIATKLPDGYATRLPNGISYGEALLAPTTLYAPLVEACRAERIELHYVINITGHGWRKLMRANAPFNYIIDRVPPIPPIFEFMMEHGPVELAEAYGNLNMGAGFAIIVDPRQAQQVLNLAGAHGCIAHQAGYVDTAISYDRPETKRVVIRPLDIEWTGDALGVR